MKSNRQHKLWDPLHKVEVTKGDRFTVGTMEYVITGFKADTSTVYAHPRINTVQKAFRPAYFGLEIRDTGPLAGFPQPLMTCRHQDTLFAILLGVAGNDVPKLVYRSDSTRTLFALYTLPKGDWLAVINPVRDTLINVRHAWKIPACTGGGMSYLTRVFFEDVEYFINNKVMPEGRDGF